MNKKFFKKSLAVTTSVATTLSVSGVSMLAPVMVAASSHIMEGDTIKTADNPDVYIAKHVGSKKFKRLILNPQVFESYGHLEWEDIKTVSDADMAMYTTTGLVRAVDDAKVYELTSEPNSDTGVKKWLNMTADEFIADGYDWDAIYEINQTDRDNYTVGADLGSGGTTPDPDPVDSDFTGVRVSLSSDTSSADSVAMGAQDVKFAKIDFVGGTNSTVSSIAVQRSGLANDTDLSDVKLWDGSQQLGTAQALNTTTHKATFTGLSWVVPAGTTKVLTITGSIAGTGTAATSTAPRLGIASAADITVDTEVDSASTFPVRGNAMTIAGLAVGRMDVTIQSTPADQSPISGSTDQSIASWQFAATNEGFEITKIKITNTGSAGQDDFSNVTLKISGEQVGSPVASVGSDGTATFDLSDDPIKILSGSNKIVYAHADIAAGITTSRTIDFEITNATDVTAIGDNSGGVVTITTGSGTTYSAQNGTAQTISQGTVLSVTTNGATHPTAQTYIRGNSQVLLSAFKFSVGSGETQRVTRIKLSLGGTSAAATDVSNITMYMYDQDTGEETQVGSSGGFVGTIATFGVNTTPTLDEGIFDIPESENYILHVRGDITSSADADATLIIFVNEVRVDGVQSEGDIGAATITAVDTAAEVMATGHSIDAEGTLTLAAAPSNPAAQNVVPGTKDYEFLKVDLTMASEGATVSAVSVNLCDNTAGSCASSDQEAGDFSSVKLWDVTGGGMEQLGSTVSSPGTSAAAFSFNLTLEKDVTKTLLVTANVPTDAYSVQWNASTAWVGFDASTLVTTGVSSAADIDDPSSDVIGNTMTAQVETLTVGFQILPATTIVVNAAQAILSKVVLTAGTAGDVKVSSIKFTASSSTTLDNPGAIQAETSFGNMQLFDGATKLGTTKEWTSASGGDTVTFSGLTLNVTKGQSVALTLKGDVKAAGDTNYFIGFTDLTGGGTATDVVATGLESNSTIYGTGTDDDDSGQITLATAGTLTVEVGSDSPSRKFVAVGSSGKTGVKLNTIKLTATNEAIDLEKLAFTMEASDDTNTDGNDVDNFDKLYLHKDGSSVASAFVTVATSSDVGNAYTLATTTFNFTTPLRVPKGESVTIQLVADLVGTSQGANSTTTPHFYIYSLSQNPHTTSTILAAKGVDSGSRSGLTLTNGSGTKAVTTVGNFNDFVVVKSKPIFALCTASNCSKASPSGSLVPGTSEAIRYRITAEGSDVLFDAANHNLQFTIAQSHTHTGTGRNAILYEVGKTAALQTVSTTLGTHGAINFQYATTSIASGGYKEYYVTVDLTDYTATGNTFRLSIENNSSAPTGGSTDNVTEANDIEWGDDVTADITIDAITDGIPMTGNTLTK